MNCEYKNQCKSLCDSSLSARALFATNNYSIRIYTPCWSGGNKKGFVLAMDGEDITSYDNIYGLIEQALLMDISLEEALKLTELKSKLNKNKEEFLK